MTIGQINKQRTAMPRLADATIYGWNDLYTQLTKGLTGPPIEMYIVRHAQSVANARGLVTGQSDAGLTLRGYTQALMLGLRLPRRCDVTWVSCLGRAMRTLEIAQILRFNKISPTQFHPDPRLDERALGDLEGTPHRPIQAYTTGDLAYAPNRGESYLDLSRRLLSFLVDVRRRTQCETRVLIATHVGPMRILVGTVEGLGDARSVLALQFHNAEAYRCVLRDLKWPAFIPKEVLIERDRPMEATHSASDHSQI